MLKSLELFGFKSFADRTRFDFAPGITGVVGPNGSGKSNVVDAIKWILGDQSAKSLRGKEMADVIFNGAAGRKPANVAEATLTFDNAGGFLPHEASEVQIGRRLWRSGDSEYLINQAPARLKDVRDLFLGSGAGTAAYNIIEQGRVDQILQTNAVSRRTIFEEAAGISRFRQRRTEAFRKLERVDQNLLRLTDIVDEVEARRNSLRTQAARAAKFREVSEELRTIWLGLAADDQRHLSAQLADHERALAECDERLTALHARRQDVEAALSALDLEIDAVDARLRRVEHSRAANREAIARHESTVRHQSARRSEVESELIRLREQRSTTAERAQEAELERQRLEQQLEALEREFLDRQQQRDERRRQIEAVGGEIAAGKQALDARRRELPDRLREVTAAATRLNEHQLELRAARGSRQHVAGQLRDVEQQTARCRAECDRRDEAARHSATAMSAGADRVQELRRERNAADGRRSESQETLTELREKRSAADARQSVLEDLERRQQGLGIGVREILSRARTSYYPPWNGIRGSVADLLEVDLEHAALLEVALGLRSQLLVIEDVDPLLDYLAEGVHPISGRVGFVTAGARGGRLEHFMIDDAASADLSGRPGVQSRADRLVRGPADLPGLAERLLADTWIIDTLPRAIELSGGDGRGCRFVTLAGEVLEADGTLIVGSPRSESSIVWRKSELRAIRDELARIDDRIGGEEHRLRLLAESLASADGELERAEVELQQLTDRHAEHKAAAVRQHEERERLLGRRADLEAELARLDGEAERLTGAIHAAANDQATLEEALGAFQEQLEQAERELARREHRLQTHRQRQAAEQLEMAKCEERLAALRGTVARLDEDRRQRALQLQDAERRLHAGTHKLREIDLHWLNAEAALAELFLEDERAEQEAETLIGEKASLKTRRGGLAEEDAAVRRERRQLDEQRHASEMALRDLRHQLTTLAQRISEEYQVELDEVVAGGTSAYEQWIAENVSEQSVAAGGPPAAGVSGGPPAAAITREDDRRAACRHVAAGVPAFEDVRPELEARVDRLRRKLKLMGSVDTESLGSLDELESRYAELSSQLADLQEARAALDRIIRRIDDESRRLFVETFEAVRGQFRELFRKLFGGGDGDLVLEDPDDVLECGLDIVARPPGKELKSISLMSGGEKTLTAFALLLALFKTRPSPYCLLDEVDAALDEANVGRLLALLDDFKQTTQFVIVTHKKPTMAIADVLYGVTMEQSGVSKRLSVRFEDVSEDGEFQTNQNDGLRAAA